MPVRLTPQPGTVVPTKRVTPDGWEPAGEHAEYFEILVFLRTDTLDAARKAGRRSVVQKGKPGEELDDAAYYMALFNSQLKGWRLLDPEGAEIPYTPENVAALPWDVQGFLHGEILRCGGIIPTEHLITKGADGTLLTFQGPADGVV